MSFRIIVFGILLILCSCGVKGPPAVPPNTEIPAFDEKFKKPILRPLLDTNAGAQYELGD